MSPEDYRIRALELSIEMHRDHQHCGLEASGPSAVIAVASQIDSFIRHGLPEPSSTIPAETRDEWALRTIQMLRGADVALRHQRP